MLAQKLFPKYINLLTYSCVYVTTSSNSHSFARLSRTYAAQCTLNSDSLKKKVTLRSDNSVLHRWRLYNLFSNDSQFSFSFLGRV